MTRGFREGGGRAKGVRLALKVFTRQEQLEMEAGAADGGMMETGLVWRVLP